MLCVYDFLASEAADSDDTHMCCHVCQRHCVPVLKQPGGKDLRGAFGPHGEGAQMYTAPN